MRHRLFAILVTVALLAIAAVPARAQLDPGNQPVPFERDFCETLIDLGAPFRAAFTAPPEPEFVCLVVTGVPTR